MWEPVAGGGECWWVKVMALPLQFGWDDQIIIWIGSSGGIVIPAIVNICGDIDAYLYQMGFADYPSTCYTTHSIAGFRDG